MYVIHVLKTLDQKAERLAAFGRNSLLTLTLLALPTLAIGQVTTVRTAPVTEDVVQEHRRVTGSLQAVSRALVASQESGLITDVLVDEGSVVQAGEVIAKLDARRLHAQLDEARAAHENAIAVVAEQEAEFSFAEYERDRIQRLFKANTASERERNEAVRLHGVRKAQLAAAQKVVDSTARQVELLEIRLADTDVKAPFDARVVSRHVEPGEWIQPGEPLVTLISAGHIEARLEVPERYAESLLSGVKELYVEIAADGRSLPSLDVRPVPDIDPRARTFQVFVTLDNTSGELAPGMSVNAWVPTSEKKLALLAPKDAVIRNGRNAYVYRVENGDTSTAQRQPVTVLFAQDDELALTPEQGLTAGDQVIVEGNERLFPGTQVAVAAHTQTVSR